MLTYYNGDFSPNCLKTKIILVEANVDHRQVDVTREALRRGDYAAAFPNQKVPAIEDGDIRISESGAIALYLVEHHGAPAPAITDAAARALMHQAMHLEAALFAPVVGGFGIFGELAKPEAERDMARVARLKPEVHRVARVLGAVLGDRAYFAGDFSIADAQLYAGLTKAIGYGVIEDVPPNLREWNDRMSERPAVVEAKKAFPMYG